MIGYSYLEFFIVICCFSQTSSTTNKEVQDRLSASDEDVSNDRIEMMVDVKPFCSLNDDIDDNQMDLGDMNQVNYDDGNSNMDPDNLKPIKKEKSSPSNRVSSSSGIFYKPKCCMCGEEFATQQERIKHSRTIHPDGAVPPGKTYSMKHKYECSLCKRRFWKRIYLMDHYDNPSYVEPTRYVVEKVPTTRKQYHQKLYCSHCGRTCHSPKELEAHEAHYHGEKIFQCDLCPKRFGHKWYLQKHLKSIHAARTHVCDTCGQAFKLAVALKRHVQVHQEVKRFKCDHCPRTFSYVHVLKNHIVVEHSGIQR